MNGPGGWDGDMPNLRSPGSDVPPIGDAAYEALLAGNLPPGDADAGLRPLAQGIAALTAAPSARELAGEPDARAVYRGGFGLPSGAAHARRRNRVLASVLSVKLAAAAVVAAGGLTAAAYADVLPAPVQDFAHRTVGAPAPHPESTPGQPVTPAVPTPPGQQASHAGQPSAASSHAQAGHPTGKPAGRPQPPGPSQPPGPPAGWPPWPPQPRAPQPPE